MSDIPAFLSDHAHLERKAAANAVRALLLFVGLLLALTAVGIDLTALSVLNATNVFTPLALAALQAFWEPSTLVLTASKG